MTDDKSSAAREAARCYRLYRPALPQALLDDILARVRPGGWLLDLACGPGRVALALAHSFVHVTAVDLSPEMIAEARIAAAERGIANVDWQIAPAEDAEAAPGAFALVTFGDAFHRFDPATILPRVRRWLAPGGAIAILSSHDTLSGAAPWHKPVRDIVAAWSKRDPAALAAPMLPPEICKSALRAHGFSDVATRIFDTGHAWTADAILGNLHSTSYCARHALGADADAFADEVRQALAPFAVDGKIAETLRFTYTFGRS